MLCCPTTDLFTVEGSYVPRMFLMRDWHNQSVYCMIYSIYVGCSLCLGSWDMKLTSYQTEEWIELYQHFPCAFLLWRGTALFSLCDLDHLWLVGTGVHYFWLAHAQFIMLFLVRNPWILLEMFCILSAVASPEGFSCYNCDIRVMLKAWWMSAKAQPFCLKVLFRYQISPLRLRQLWREPTGWVWKE